MYMNEGEPIDTSKRFGDLVHQMLYVPLELSKISLRETLDQVEGWDADRKAVLKDLYENMVLPISYEPDQAQFYRVFEKGERIIIQYSAISDIVHLVTEATTKPS